MNLFSKKLNELEKGWEVVAKKESQKNYLEFIPVQNADFPWKVNEKGIVTVMVTNKGFYNTIAQKFFKKPRVSKIQLDEFGSFIWQQIDGETNIYAISEKVKENFGKKAEPLYPRLLKFFEILKDNKFVTLEEK